MIKGNSIVSASFFVLLVYNRRKESKAYASLYIYVFSRIGFPRIYIVLICVNGVYIFLFNYFLRNKLVITNLGSKETNCIIEYFIIV
jgi:hypothetical protein